MSGPTIGCLSAAERGYCLLAAATAGAAVLAMEVLAARSMAPALGTGPVAWSSLLAVSLGMLAAGNLLGGVLCNRCGTASLIAWPLAVAAAWIVTFTQVQSPVMQCAAGMSLVTGNLVAAMSIQSGPLAMLGLVTPAILRAGRGSLACWDGLTLAVGSGGAVGGALVTGLVLLPQVGLTRSYVLLAILLLLTALPAAWSARRWMAAVLVAMLAAAAVCYAQCPDAAIQSQYGQIEVRQLDAAKVLLIDGLPQTGMQAEVRPGEPLQHGYLLEAVLFWRRRPADALVIGLGAGLAPRVLRAHGIACESIEIDPQVVEIARREFGFDGPVTVADGRAILDRTARQYDLIFLDVCTSDRLPWQLFTREALKSVCHALRDDGMLVVQFIGDDGPWSASLARTADEVFGQSVTLAPAASLVAVEPRWLFAAKGRGVMEPPWPFAPTSPAPWKRIEPGQGGRLLIDDHFPAQWDWARTAARWRSRYAAIGL